MTGPGAFYVSLLLLFTVRHKKNEPLCDMTYTCINFYVKYDLFRSFYVTI